MPQERPNIGFFTKPPQALFPRRLSTKGDHDLEDPVFISRHGFNTWLFHSFKRRRDYYGMLQAAKGENFFDHSIEGFHFAHQMDIADRAANGLRINLVFDNQHPDPQHKSKFGLMVNYGYNNPALADHVHPHLRRVERFVETMLLNIGELRHSQSVKQFIDPLLLYANFHDLAQIYNLQHNLTYPEEKIADVKRAHGLEGAIMLLVLHRRYALERKISIHDAWQKSAQAAVMIMIHNAPEKFMRILNSSITAHKLVGHLNSKSKQIKKLAEVFDKDSDTVCDVTTITPSDLLKTLALLKGKGEEDRSYGLPKQFVQEYKKEVNDLAVNDLPLMQYEVIKAGIPEGEKEAFKLAAEVALMADLIDMRIPGEESIFRTLRTQKSRNRQFFPTENFQYNQVKNLIFKGSGEIATDNPFFSDVIRILWESVNIEKLISGLPENNPLLNSGYLKNIIKDASIMSILSLQAIGNRLLARDFNVVDEVFKRRRLVLIKKAESRTSLRLAHLNNDQLRHKLLHDDTTDDIGKRLTEEIRNLNKEKREIRDNLNNKIPTTYADEQISAFNELINQVLAELFARYQVTPKEETRYRKLVTAHRLPKSLPYRSYESLGIFPPKTLVDPIGIIAIASMRQELDQKTKGLEEQ